jgi:2,4-dichlorophenol 6-monooxygenase
LRHAEEVDVPVTIIGAGPAGLVASLLLSKYGIAHALVEKYPRMAHTPRAHIINQRTVEILRDLGLEDEFRAIAMPWELMENIVWHASLSGLELARRQAWGTSPARHADYVSASPCGMANCGQHLLEPFLYRAAASSPLADIRLNHEFVQLSQDDAGVTAIARERSSGRKIALRSSYLVGADGGRSRISRQIGLDYDGRDGISASATIHFRADLARFTARRPGTLYMNAVPGIGGFRGAGTLICHQPWFEWALAFSYDPDKLDATDEALARQRLLSIIGDQNTDIEILNISTWTINRTVARSYSAGRVFCIGDAVHRHPPFNGLGLNTSVADAYNLAWKLALVIDGRARAALLGSYSAERQPVGVQVVDRAIASMHDLAALQQAFDFNAAQTGQTGERAIKLLYEPGPEGEARRERVSAALAVTDYQFNAHGVELGYRYPVGAVVRDGSPEPVRELDPDLYYQPTSWPGARLPHAWIEIDGIRLSTLDLIQGNEFALITGIGGDGWRDAARHASEAASVDIAVYEIGALYGPVDCYGDWRRLRGVDDSGCVLIRPDRHVAWRAKSASPESLGDLAGVMETLLGGA